MAASLTEEEKLAVASIYIRAENSSDSASVCDNASIASVNQPLEWQSKTKILESTENLFERPRCVLNFSITLSVLSEMPH